jgi:VIT1/CCC1 family predicted Fe2+/Mn2+ transporter
MREQELAETRHIFRLKGITGPLLDEVVTAVSRNDESWVSLMMTEELGFPDHPPRPTLAAALMGLSFAAAATFPVVPYMFFDGTLALAVSLGATAMALFGVGAWRARLSQGRVWIKAAEMVVLAGVAVGAAYVIGDLIGNVVP